MIVVRMFVALVALVGCRVHFDAIGDASGSPDDALDTGGDAPPGAIAAVQTTPLLSVNGSNPFTVTFPNPTTSGNRIVAYVWSWALGGTSYDDSSMSDTFGNTWDLVTGQLNGGTNCAGGAAGAVLYVSAPIAGGADHSISVNAMGAAMQEFALVAVEYQGLSANPPLDFTAALTSSTSPATVDTGDISFVEDGALLVSVASLCGGVPDPVTWAAQPGFTTRGIESMTLQRVTGIGGDRIVAVGGTYSESWTATFTGAATIPVFGAIAALR